MSSGLPFVGNSIRSKAESNFVQGWPLISTEVILAGSGKRA